MSRYQYVWLEKILNKPHIILSFLALFVFVGFLGFGKIHQNLFPNSNYPEVAIVITQKGASAKSIANNVAVVVEEELYSLDGIRRAYSNTIDEVTVIRAEFEYEKNVDTALNDVTNALAKIKNKLPKDILEPQTIKITQATAPVMVVALSPATSEMAMEDVRDLANSEIKHQLLKTKGVANVDIFGGYQKELHIIIDKKRLDSLNLSLANAIGSIQTSHQDYAIGFLNTSFERYLLTAKGKNEDVESLKNIPIAHNVKLSDIADVYFGHYDNSALYYGNGKKAIALAIQRSLSADVVTTIQACETTIAKLEKQYPKLQFSLADTQKDTIVQSTQNMFEGLRDAIVMSTIVVFLFLASFRQILVVLGTIPLVYASTIGLMWLVGIEFNVVTLTGIILALGLLLDDTVVVMENIERHYTELQKPIRNAVIEGTKEVMFADLSGTITTMIALAPMLFVGGYPQTVFAPLVGTLLLALLASYVVSIVAVPLLSLYILTIKTSWILQLEKRFHLLIQFLNENTVAFFSLVTRKALESKKIGIAYFVVLIGLFIISVKLVMPTVGQELMPPMDTGGVTIKITMESNLPIEKSEEVLQKIYTIVASKEKLLRSSAMIGSEAGVVSIGSGSGIEQMVMVATYVDRHKRDQDIWHIARELRKEVEKIPHIKYIDIAPYGATAMASIRANVDAMISASSLEILHDEGKKVEEALMATKGIVSVSKTWDMDKRIYDIRINEMLALQYGLNKEEVTKQMQVLLRGMPLATFPKENSLEYTLRIWVKKSDIASMHDLLSTLIVTPKGKIPLEKLATIEQLKEPTVITREGLNYTLEIYGNREKGAISHIMSDFEAKLAQQTLHPDSELEHIGDIKQFLSSAKRMVSAIAIAVILIFFALVMMFGSIKIALMILFSIPLTLIGASWAMLTLGYHTSMPAMMGFILLSGVIVNNAILLIHFALERMEMGINKYDAMLESIKIRTRPVLMTAFSVSAGMLPVAQGAAIGLERLAPLGAVAIGGLIIGTLMTLVFIPIVFVWTTNDSSLPKEQTL